MDRRSRNRWYALGLAALLAACAQDPGPAGIDTTNPPDTTRDTVTIGRTAIPLTDFAPTQNYLGFKGGLYPDGSNVLPPDHLAEGLRRARAIGPLDRNGSPSAAGDYIFLSAGMSNTTQEFCAQGGQVCEPWTFVGRARREPAVADDLVLLNGAKGGEATDGWDAPGDVNYQRIASQVLPPAYTEKQVVVAWAKMANARPTVALPSQQAEVYRELRQLGDVVRAMKVRYPNLGMIFFSTRIYGGYARIDLHPEPYAYESGFAVKWLIAAQIEQMRTGRIDPVAGDLNYNTVAPWLAWGPYLWAAGATPRSDGLQWLPADFQSDGTHPSQSGEAKVGTLLWDYFRTSPVTRCWFLDNATCG